MRKSCGIRSCCLAKKKASIIRSLREGKGQNAEKIGGEENLVIGVDARVGLQDKRPNRDHDKYQDASMQDLKSPPAGHRYSHLSRMLCSHWIQKSGKLKYFSNICYFINLVKCWPNDETKFDNFDLQVCRNFILAEMWSNFGQKINCKYT